MSVEKERKEEHDIFLRKHPKIGSFLGSRPEVCTMNRIDERDSNLELLRIMAMLMVLSLHYFPHSILNTNIVSAGTHQYYLGWLLETLCIIGPNVFTIMSAWFLCDRKESDLRKALLLYIKMTIYNLILFIPGLLFNSIDVSVHNVILLIFPFLGGRYWYIETYILLLMLYPFMNYLIHNISQQSYKILLAIWVGAFSIWFTFFSSPPIQDYGYGITTFVTCYLLTAYIKIYGFGNGIMSRVFDSKIGLISVYILSSGVSFLLATKQIGGVIEFIFPNDIAHGYCSIWVILSALSFFLYFKKISIRRSSIINGLASVTMGIYIVHCNYSCIDLIYNRIMYASAYANSDFFILIWLSQVIAQFLVSGIVVKIIDAPIGYAWKRIVTKPIIISCEK